MIFSKSVREIEVRLSHAVLENVFDECDRHDRDETGGKIIGTYEERNRKISISVDGVIDAGPNTRRTPTSLFQDGEYQANVFRKIELEHPEIEHLGTWHSHHVNGYPELSSGDIETYQRSVNHELHNLPFFYALLVVSRHGGALRYKVKHYVLFRGQQSVFEIPSKNVKIVDTSPVWLPTIEHKKRSISAVGSKSDCEYVGTEMYVEIDCNHWNDPRCIGAQSRAVTRERDVAAFGRELKEFYPSLSPFYSKSTESVYWKGTLRAIDGTRVNVRVFEVQQNGDSGFVASITSDSQTVMPGIRTEIRSTPLQAALDLEHQLNELLFLSGVRGRLSARE